MKTARMIIGIVSMVLFFLIAFQSCAAGVVNTIEGSGDTSGSSGFILALCMLIAGIVGVAARKSKGGSITAGVFYIIGGLIGAINVGVFKDLAIWSVIAIVFGVVFIVTAIKQKVKKLD